MKFKDLLLASLFFGSLIATSCTQEKECECVTTTLGLVVDTSDKEIDEGECEDLNQEVTDASGAIGKIECTEK